MATQAIDYEVFLHGLRRSDFEVDYREYMITLDLLMKKGESLSEKEARLLGVVGVLIQDYETRRFKVGRSVTPRDVLSSLMVENGLRHRDVWEIFGSRGIASEVINGKREITLSQAKRLAKRFNVSVAAFL